MFSQLSGNIVGIRGSSVTLNVHGVGYKVSVSPYTLGKVAGAEEVTLYVHTYVREDQIALYGFISEDELDMFELLISVSGIGPRAGLSILSIADTDTIRSAVVNKDPSILTQVSGVGKKTAERVIIELQNKVAAPTGKTSSDLHADQEVIEALLSLGYHVTEARDSIAALPSDITGVNERVHAALKSLGKK